MPSRKTKFQTPGAKPEILDKELSTIHRMYIELDDAILHGQGSPRILEAACALVEFMLWHFKREEQLQKKLSFSVRGEQRKAWRTCMAELVEIEAGLKQDEVYAALRSRAFCKAWIHGQIPADRAEFEIASLAAAPQPDRARA